MAELKDITKAHVLQAVARIEKERIALRPSTQHDVLIGGKVYPPKEILRYAWQEMTGELVHDLTSGGIQTNRPLEKLGFEVRPKVAASPSPAKGSPGRRYWRAGTGHDGNDFWPDMKQARCICIGLGDIGDLKTLGIKAREDILDLLPKKKPKRTFSKEAGEAFNFFNDVRTGDIVLAQAGQQVKGIGIVTGGYGYNDALPYPHYRAVRWLLENPSLRNGEGGGFVTFKEMTGQDLIKKIEKALTKKEGTPIMANELNQILYGPPGTGKTYRVVEEALHILGESAHGSERTEIAELFERHQQAGRVVFTTFHQSMAYEDFIEGLKPVEPEEGNPVVYRVEDGTFKELCINAAFSFVEKSGKQHLDSTP